MKKIFITLLLFTFTAQSALAAQVSKPYSPPLAGVTADLGSSPATTTAPTTSSRIKKNVTVKQSGKPIRYAGIFLETEKNGSNVTEFPIYQGQTDTYGKLKVEIARAENGVQNYLIAEKFNIERKVQVNNTDNEEVLIELQGLTEDQLSSFEDPSAAGESELSAPVVIGNDIPEGSSRFAFQAVRYSKAGTLPGNFTPIGGVQFSIKITTTARRQADRISWLPNVSADLIQSFSTLPASVIGTKRIGEMVCVQSAKNTNGTVGVQYNFVKKIADQTWSNANGNFGPCDSPCSSGFLENQANRGKVFVNEACNGSTYGDSEGLGGNGTIAASPSQTLPGTVAESPNQTAIYGNAESLPSEGSDIGQPELIANNESRTTTPQTVNQPRTTRPDIEYQYNDIGSSDRLQDYLGSMFRRNTYYITGIIPDNGTKSGLDLVNLPAGQYSIKLNKSGYKSKEIKFNLNDSENITQTVRIKMQPTRGAEPPSIDANRVIRQDIGMGNKREEGYIASGNFIYLPNKPWCGWQNMSDDICTQPTYYEDGVPIYGNGPLGDIFDRISSCTDISVGVSGKVSSQGIPWLAGGLVMDRIADNQNRDSSDYKTFKTLSDIGTMIGAVKTFEDSNAYVEVDRSASCLPEVLRDPMVMSDPGYPRYGETSNFGFFSGLLDSIGSIKNIF